MHANAHGAPALAAAAARYKQVWSRRVPAAGAGAVDASVPSDDDPMSSLFRLYDLVTQGAAEGEPAGRAARAERKAAAAAAAASAAAERTMLHNYLPLVQKALSAQGIAFDEAALRGEALQSTSLLSAAASAVPEEGYVYDVYELDDTFEDTAGAGAAPEPPAVLVRPPEDFDDDSWGLNADDDESPGSSDADAAEVDYPEDEDEEGPDFDEHGLAVGGESEESEEGEDWARRRSGVPFLNGGESEEEYDTVAYDEQEAEAAAAARAAAGGGVWTAMRR
jgi:hypothetical protein